MDGGLGRMLPYLLLATGAGVAGGILACFWKPRLHARSAIQHFAAGLVTAAVASEIMPAVERVGAPLATLAGFAAGGLAMIVLKWGVLKLEKRDAQRRRLPAGLAAAAAVDTLIDGAIIAAGFAAGPRAGPLLAIALATELLFLTLSVGAEFQRGRRGRRLGLAVTSGIAALLPAGALGAHLLLRGAPEATVALFLAFGAAALIYLIAEELLVESVQAEESLLSTAMLFAGVLALLALKVLSGGAG